jgi:hypothetical protein
MNQVVDSFLFFVDSDEKLQRDGDDFLLDLSSAGLTAGAGQHFRVRVQNFAMYKNWYSVNENNNSVVVRTNLGDASVSITPQNYRTIGEIVENLAEQVRVALGATSIASVRPDANLTLQDATDRIVDFTLNWASPHGITSCVGQAYEDMGDSYALLGVDRIIDINDTTTDSFATTIVDANTIRFKGLYPAQRSTEEHLYLRSTLTNGNFETPSLSKSSTSSHILNSDILAKIPIDHEVCSFNTISGDEYFVNVPSKSITNVRLYLTDAKERRIPSAGTGTRQSSLGNIHFNAVLRFDLIQAYEPGQHGIAPVSDNRVLTHMDAKY